MLGQNYFHTRSKLGSAVYALSQLGEKAGVETSRLNVLRDLMANLKDPFLFVVVGEVNAGKSTLLNAVFGSDFCSTDVLPTTDKICFFKHGNESHEFEVSDTLLEIYRPNEFLKDFNVVDTPGTNSIEQHHQKITEHFIPMADLVLFVFSVTNPWGATAWDLLDRIHHQWKKKVVFILQQCDLRTDEEVRAILEHLKRTADHRFGVDFPTFAISAKQAFLAKTTGVDKERLWGTSGFSHLERFVSDVVESSETRLTKLINAWRGACFVLGEVKDRLATASEIIRADRDLLSGLEQAAQLQEKRTHSGRFEPLFEAFDKSYMAAGLQAEPLLESRLNLFSSLLPPGRTPEDIENLVFATTMKSVRRNIADGAAAVEDDVKLLWDHVADEMQEHFNLSLSIGETGQPDWTEYRDRIRSSVEGKTAETLKNLELKSTLARVLSRRCRLLWSLIIFAALSGVGAGVLWWLKMTPWDAAALGFTAFVLLIGAILGSRSANKIRRLYSDRIEGQREDLHAVQRRSFREGVSSFYIGFVKLFEPLRKVCKEHREKYEPQLKQVDDLEKTLAELERVLKPVEQVLAARVKEQAAAGEPVSTKS